VYHRHRPRRDTRCARAGAESWITLDAEIAVTSLSFCAWRTAMTEAAAAGGIRTEESSPATQLPMAAMLVAAFLWPAELPIAIFWHGVAFPTVGSCYVLLLHATFVLIAACPILLRAGARIPDGPGNARCFIASCCLLLFIGLMPLVVSAVSTVDSNWAFQDFAFGFAAPVVFAVALATLPAHQQQRVWVAFYAGWVAFLSISVFVLAREWRAAADAIPAFAAAPPAQKLIMWRFTLGQPWNLYGIVMGNANKMSNYLVIFLLTSVEFLNIDGNSPKRRALLGIFWLLAVLTLVVMLSRAAMLLLPLVVLASGLLRQTTARVRRVAVLVAVSAIVAIVIAAPEVMDYLLAARYLPDGDSDADPLGTFGDRLVQWAQLKDYLAQHPRVAAFGLGTSGYGLRFFGQPESGTHNTFLDLWTNGGVLSPILLLCLIGLALLQALGGTKSRTRRIASTAGLLALSLLMMREHSFSYLYVTSLGGLCVAALLYATIAPEDVQFARSRATKNGACKVAPAQ